MKLSNNKLFWILQFAGWIIYSVSMQVLFYKSDQKGFIAVFLFYISYILGFIFTILLRYYYRYLRRKIKPIQKLLIIVALSVLILVPVWYFIDILISSYFWDEIYVKKYFKVISFFSVLRSIYLPYVVFYGWTALYFSIKYWVEWQSEKKRSEEAMSMAQKAQLEMLRYQLNPHFLFNSLNSIRALVDEDQKSAKNMITELSEFLRYSLIDKDLALRPLREELSALKHYLAIEKKRFEEKLLIEYKIASETENKPVLSFLIHPIIENAIKYGMQTSKMPLQLLIRSYMNDDKFLHIEICNSGKWVERDKTNMEGTGTGLMNVENRLKNAYRDRYTFQVNKDEDKVCIKIGLKIDESESE